MASTTPMGSPSYADYEDRPLVGSWNGKQAAPETPLFSRSKNPFTAEDSPTSTLADSTSFVPDSFRGAHNRLFESTNGASGKQAQIRADPSLATCFDPADKELYDLWAPKR